MQIFDADIAEKKKKFIEAGNYLISKSMKNIRSPPPGKNLIHNITIGESGKFIKLFSKCRKIGNLEFKQGRKSYFKSPLLFFNPLRAITPLKKNVITRLIYRDRFLSRIFHIRSRNRKGDIRKTTSMLAR